MTWSVFSKNRSYLMGLAIAVIMIFHWCEDYTIHLTGEIYHTVIGHAVWFIVGRVVWIGACGVEIFLFLSGIGLYFSYTRNPDIKRFYKKRLTAIAVPYLIIAVPYLIWQNFIFTNNGLLNFFADLFLVTTFTPFNRQSWYVVMILVMYAAFPLFYLCMKKRPTIGFVVLELIFGSLPFAVQLANKELFDQLQIALTRIPFFILGAYCGKFVYEDKKIKAYPVVLIICIAATFIIKHLMKNMNIEITVLARYERGLITMLLLIGAAIVLERFELSRIKRVLLFLAPMTLELYLSHVEIRRMFYRLFTGGWNVPNLTLTFISIIAISVPVPWYVSRVSGRITSKLIGKS